MRSCNAATENLTIDTKVKPMGSTCDALDSSSGRSSWRWLSCLVLFSVISSLAMADVGEASDTHESSPVIATAQSAGNTSTDSTQVIRSRVAILVSHEPRDISYYTDLRRGLYESWSLRLIRFVDRSCGLRMDGDDLTFRLVAIVLLILFTSLIFFGFLVRSFRSLGYGLAGGVFLTFIAWVSVFSGIAKINQYDMRGAHHVQTILDVTTAEGIETDFFWEWQDFVDAWSEEGVQPYTTVAWMGIPLGGEELLIETWLNEHRDMPMLQLCLGAHLPRSFHRPMFGATPPELTCTKDSAQSVCDRGAAYGRTYMWHNPADAQVNAEASLVPWGKNLILYTRADAPWASLSRWLKNGQRQLQHGAWGRAHLKGVAVLRLDDPGSAVGAYLESWTFPTLDSNIWEQVNEVLRNQNASMTVGYVPAWLDDGDVSRGKLSVAGQELTSRPAGAVYPSEDVVYEHAIQKQTYDLQAQAKTLENLSQIDLQLHGFSHITPEVDRWLSADNQYENHDWYREFLGTESKPYQQRDWKVQTQLLEQGQEWFERAFSQKPSVMIPPGHAVSWDTAELVLQQGLLAMCGRHLVLGSGNQARRTRAIASVDMNEIPLPSSAITQTLVLHDLDLHRGGVAWFKSSLEKWEQAGVRRFVSLSELLIHLLSSPSLSWQSVQDTHHLILDVPALPDVLISKLKGNERLEFECYWDHDYVMSTLPEGLNHVSGNLFTLPITGQPQSFKILMNERAPDSQL